MEVLEKVGDWFNAFTAGIERSITTVFGSANERRIRQFGFVREKDGSSHVVPGSLLERINNLEPEIERQSDDELKQTAPRLRERLAQGETLDDILPEAFAAVREAGKRYLKMRHYDVQMVGGYFLHKGMIAEMVTGEGKTLVATLPAFLNALTGHVHVITVNDYLARRDMEWMGPLHIGLGLTVGAIQSQMGYDERRKAYACDITYGTNNEFGFDYLRDNMKPTTDLQCQGPLDFAIVDEIDNILIDEARTPLIISGPAHDDIAKYAKADRIAKQLQRDAHFEIKEKEHTCHMTEDGVRHAEELAARHGYIKEGDSFYTAGNMEWPHLIDNALKAYHLYKRDVNYVVQGDEVVIVDEFTGRLMPGRQWSDGLHQAVEAKEGVRVKAENQTLATITLQNFFKLYRKLCGMTGTAMTEATEFLKVYNLDVVSIPANRPMQRVNYSDVIFRSEKEKWNAVVDEIREIHKTGRPILVGTVSIEKSELLSSKLNKFGIQHNVLNAKHHEREAEIIAQAGRLGAVTIATNMAGRGTDIILGGNPEHMAWEEVLRQKYDSRLEIPKWEWDEATRHVSEREGMAVEARKVSEAGGLHVIGTERHEARRIDLQLRGRSGRQGDPGSSRFFLSLEDDLMRKFAGEWVGNMLTMLGMQEGEAIESGMVTRRVEAAQKKVEERHFDQRKNLLEYDEVMDEQRKTVYSYRQRILEGANCRQLILDMIDRQVEKAVERFLAPNYRWETIAAWAGQQYGIEVGASSVREMDKDQLVEYLSDEAREQADELIQEQIDENLPEDAEDEREWNWLALSKWANARWGLNTNDRELKKVGRDDVREHIRERAHEAVERFDFSVLDTLLAEDLERRTLCGWLNHQFTLQAEPDEFLDRTPDEVRTIIRQKIDQLYAEKEIRFPVAVAMTNFMAETPGGGERYNRDGLVRWANDRFHLHLDAEEVRHRSRADIERMLTEWSRRYLGSQNGEVAGRINDYLERAWGGHEANGRPAEHTEALAELAAWANREFRAELDPAELQGLSQADVRQRVLQEYDKRFRPELAQAERALLLEILDTSWKDHLYYMDHLRATIGLAGYAQKDPKVEYKKEGQRAFKTMWDRIGEQATAAIFRLEKQSPAFVGSLWQITDTTHADPNTAYKDEPDYVAEGPGREPGQEIRTIDPIKNRQPRVGRNDPCPCGSGKKYKKCCGT